MDILEVNSLGSITELPRLPRPPSLVIAIAQVQGLAPDELDSSKYNWLQSPYNANIVGAILETKNYVEKSSSFHQAMTHIEEMVGLCYQRFTDQKIYSISQQILYPAREIVLYGSPKDELLGYISGLEKEGMFSLLAKRIASEYLAIMEAAPKAEGQSNFMRNLEHL